MANGLKLVHNAVQQARQQVNTMGDAEIAAKQKVLNLLDDIETKVRQLCLDLGGDEGFYPPGSGGGQNG